MPEEEESWIMAGIPGYYSLADINAGLVSLVDVARANDHLAVKAANERMARERLNPHG
jgi:hypothetical protein